MLKRMLRRPAVQAGLATMLGWYLDMALRTTRWTLLGAEHLAPAAAGVPHVVAFWHERLPLMPALWTLARDRGADLRASVLVSRHSDGRFIGNIMARFGVGVVHGSSRRGGQERGGAAGVLALLGTLEAGGHAVITPDGPRGPRRHAAAGVAQLAALAGVPVLPCAAQTTRKIVLGSWDRMVLPLPWGRGVLVCAAPIAVARAEAEQTLPAIAQALTDAADAADRACA